MKPINNINFVFYINNIAALLRRQLHTTSFPGSFHPLTPKGWGGEMKDPGNKVELQIGMNSALSRSRHFGFETQLDGRKQ